MPRKATDDKSKVGAGKHKHYFKGKRSNKALLETKRRKKEGIHVILVKKEFAFPMFCN
jgi:hypothetical protein